MLGVIVNTLSVIIGSALGLLLKKNIPVDVTGAVMKGLGLCTLYIGWTGSLKGENTLVLIISIAVGVAIGQALDLDAKLNQFASKLERRFKQNDQEVSFAEGFVTASLIFCVGAMTIVGSLQAGLIGDNEMLFTKATLDFISALIFAATLGIGVMAAAAFVFVFQGTIVLLAQVIAPLLSDPVIAEMTCVGSVLIFALGLNILGLTKLKVMNYLPAVFLPILFGVFIS
jgi:uncharacterized membrane protein YqgA involved in biofilm formation